MKFFETACFGIAALGLGAGIVGLNAGLHGLSGLTGAAILDAAGYEGYNATEAAIMGVLGGSITGLPVGVIVSCVAGAACMGMLAGSSKPEVNTKSSSCSVTSYIVSGVLAGLIGHAIMNPQMELAQTAAAFAVGSALTCIPVSLILLCMVLPMVLGSACLAAKAVQEIERKNYNTF